MLKNVGVLTLGQGLAQLVSLLGYIGLARLYMPSAFGELAFIMAVSTMLSGVSSFQYEMTVLLAKTRRSADLAVSVSLVVSILVHSFVAGLFIFIGLIVGWSTLSYWFIALAISFFNSAQNIAVFLQNREKRYLKTVVVMIVKNSIFIVVAALFWSKGVGFNGLVYSYLLASLLVAVYLLNTEYRWARIKMMFEQTLKAKIWFFKYIDFLRFTTPAAFCSLAAQSFPVLLITTLFGEAAAGMYSMVQRVVMAPVGLVSGAINRVFLQKIGDLRAKSKPLFHYTFTIVQRMLLPVIVLSALFWLALKWGGLVMVFGEKWLGIDTLAAILIPAMAVGFLSKAVAGFAILGKNFLGMLYQVALLVLVSFSIIFTYVINGGETMVYLALSFSLSLAYLVQLFSILYITRNLDGQKLSVVTTS